MMKYLLKLSFLEAHVIFMSRYRMWPTKDNYSGRWNGLDCNICGLRDTEHMSPGYCDIVSGEFWLDVLWDESVMNDMEKLISVA